MENLRLVELTPEQHESINHYRGLSVPAQWFIGTQAQDGEVEVIALGDTFAWSLLIERDGTIHTAEAELGQFETGLNI